MVPEEREFAGNSPAPVNESPSPGLPLVQPVEGPKEEISQDYLVLRWAILGLILATMTSLIGVIGLTWAGATLPDGIIAIGSTAVGALSTMLVRPPSSRP